MPRVESESGTRGRLIRDGLVSRIEKHGRLHIAAEEPGRILWRTSTPAAT